MCGNEKQFLTEKHQLYKMKQSMNCEKFINQYKFTIHKNEIILNRRNLTVIGGKRSIYIHTHNME